MAQSEPKRIGLTVEVKPHAYDPAANPELFEGVLARRLLAFVIDLTILAMPVLFLAMFIFVIGIVTFGLGFVFYALLTPAMVLWALFYYGVTLGSRHSATIGMRAMDIEMRTWYGSPAYFVLGADRRRCLHDILVGTVLINNEQRAGSLRASARRPA
jgi:hypothetical protein